MKTKRTNYEKRYLKNLRGVYRQCLAHLSYMPNTKRYCNGIENKIKELKSV